MWCNLDITRSNCLLLRWRGVIRYIRDSDRKWRTTKTKWRNTIQAFHRCRNPSPSFPSQTKTTNTQIQQNISVSQKATPNNNNSESGTVPIIMCHAKKLPQIERKLRKQKIQILIVKRTFLGIRIIPEEPLDHRKITRFFKENYEEYHTYPREKKNLNIIEISMAFPLKKSKRISRLPSPHCCWIFSSTATVPPRHFPNILVAT